MEIIRTGEKDRNGISIAKEEIGVLIKERAITNSLVDYVHTYFSFVHPNSCLPTTGFLVCYIALIAVSDSVSEHYNYVQIANFLSQSGLFS